MQKVTEEGLQKTSDFMRNHPLGESGWIQQPKGGEAAAAPCPQVQVLVRLSICSQQTHAHRAYVYTTRAFLHMASHITNTDKHTEHSREH